MLELRDVTVCYQARPVVEGFNMTLKQGEIAALVGESGCGKTTLVRAVLGLLAGGGRVTHGDILFEGESLLQYTPEQWRRLRGTEVSMIFQDSGAMLDPIQTVGQGFVEYIRTHEDLSRRDAWKKGTAMLERMRLPDGDDIMRSYPFQLSGGMRQRVGIAMAMTFQPKLLLADEPTSALDVTTQAQIVRQMMELREEFGTAILIVTHNLGVAAYMSDQIMVMKAGRLCDAGSREEILRGGHSPDTQALLEAAPALRGARYV